MIDLFKKSFTERFRKGFANIIGNFCSARFENTFPKISRIIHFEEPHAPTLRHMIHDLNLSASVAAHSNRVGSRRQRPHSFIERPVEAERSIHTSFKGEQYRMKKRKMSKYDESSSRPDLTLEEISALTRVVIPSTRPRSGDRR